MAGLLAGRGLGLRRPGLQGVAVQLRDVAVSLFFLARVLVAVCLFREADRAPIPGHLICPVFGGKPIRLCRKVEGGGRRAIPASAPDVSNRGWRRVAHARSPGG